MRSMLKAILFLVLSASFPSNANDFKFRSCPIDQNSKNIGSVEIMFHVDGSYTADVNLNEGTIRMVSLPCSYKVETIENVTTLLTMDCRSNESSIAVQIPGNDGKGAAPYINVFKDARKLGECLIK